MGNEERKIGKIIGELTVFFLHAGGTHVTSQVNSDGNTISLLFKSDYLPEHEDDILKVKKFFDEPRNVAMEDMYWELAGSGDSGDSSQLLLIAQMAGEHEFTAENGQARLVIYKRLWE